MALQIIVTPEEQAVAINKYLAAEYGLNLSISSDSLTAVNITVKPVFEGDTTQETVTTEKEEEDDREWAEERANELGISFRSDIKTSTLISRIEDEEVRIAKEASQPEQVEEEEEVTTDTPEDAEDLFSTPEVESTSKDSTEDDDDINSLFG